MALRVVTFKAEEEFVEKLDEYAAFMGISRSEFIRYAIEKLILELNEVRGGNEDTTANTEKDEVIIIM